MSKEKIVTVMCLQCGWSCETEEIPKISLLEKMIDISKSDIGFAIQQHHKDTRACSDCYGHYDYDVLGVENRKIDGGSYQVFLLNTTK